MTPISWQDARAAVHAAGAKVAAGRPSVAVPLAEADGLTLAGPLVARTPLPAFPTSSIDGYAVRGAGPWKVTGRILAGRPAAPLTDDGTCVEIATGAMVPEGTTTILRVEDATVSALVEGTPRAPREWRDVGEECAAGEELLPAGTTVTPGVLGLAASCGYDELAVVPAPRVATIVFGDELLTAGDPGDGRVRDALGPQVPGWLRRLGAVPAPPVGPVPDTLEAHVDALRSAVETGADVICTTGGTMRGPVDHLHPALAALDAEYVVNQVAVRPGFPMLVAALPDGRFVAGLPGNPQSAIVALVSLVVPLLAGLTGRPLPVLSPVTLGAGVPGRGDYTHLALVAQDPAGTYSPLPHAGSSMLRGLSRAAGFAVIPPRSEGTSGATAALVPLP
ncbi:molybdopterin molybdenumtransferase MoeA [Virgisporangium aliadipatigenens]|uniref:Molybdopterin molybdenumtransferase n=1 Tax=Virgisporangium aliadipatigenens TaxID=741659 RepID=A0A8J3YSP6_9ACTN|nr:molybdopterin molybdenumtransferase MoeA [Virgisporangium aliadipatigenens]